MQPLNRQALAREAAALDEAVSRVPDLDHFCSGSAWTFSADVALMAPRELYCRRGDHGWALLARRLGEDGFGYLEPLEAAWCLGSPLVPSGDPDALARELEGEIAATAPLDVLVLSGLAEASPLFEALVTALRRRYVLRTTLVPPTRRFRASLEGGVAGFLSRRSPGFREKLRRAERKAERDGVTFEPLVAETEIDALALHARLLAMEARSWKGRAGEGLLVPSMAAFYREMLPRLAPRGAIRAHVGRLEGQDVALIVGGVVSTPGGLVYRGLQFSFDDAHRDRSLGNLAQLAQIRALVDEGARLYDLGSEVDYKRRWGEVCHETLTLVAVPRRARASPGPGPAGSEAPC